MRRKIYQFFPRLSRNPRWISASQGYGRVAPCRMASDALIFNTKPLSRLTGCGRLIRIIHPRKTPLARQRPEQRASHHRGERFFPADGFSGGSARLSLVRHVRRRCHPAGLSFSHRRQAAGRSKGVRGGLNPSRPHFVRRLLLAHGLIFQRDRLLDSPFSYPVLY